LADRELAGRRCVLFLARLDPKKNVEGLLRALAILADQGHADVVLLVAGSGAPNYEGALRDLARSLDVADRVIWLGHVEGARKAAAFARADLFALPSFSENFGIAVAEALCAGLPCVVGRGVAIAAEIERAGAGLAVDPDPVAIARALSDLLANRELRAHMRARAQQLVASEFSVETMVRRLIALYHELSARRGTHARSVGRRRS
jgi:glycosyltransferase involved in cell wall biosynthesis